MTGTAAEALARTVQLIALDIFDSQPGQNPRLEEAIVTGLTATTVRLSADALNLDSYAGQTSFVALFSLIAMMGIGIELDIPQTSIIGHHPPLEGDELRSALMRY